MLVRMFDVVLNCNEEMTDHKLNLSFLTYCSEHHVQVTQNMRSDVIVWRCYWFWT